MAARPTNIRARVEMRPTDEPGPRTRVVLGDEGTAGPVDLTGALVEAIAHALWEARGGDAMTNWADAEGALDQLFSATPMAARSEIKPPSAPTRNVPAIPAMQPQDAPANARRTAPRR